MLANPELLYGLGIEWDWANGKSYNLPMYQNNVCTWLSSKFQSEESALAQVSKTASLLAFDHQGAQPFSTFSIPAMLHPEPVAVMV